MGNEDDEKTEKLSQIAADISNAVAHAKTVKTKFAVLKTLIDAVEVSDRDIVDTVFNLLVGGEFDLESNFIIKDESSIENMLDIMESCSEQCQAEIWSKFKGICRNSYRNLDSCIEVGLLQKLLTILSSSKEIVSELIIDMLCLLASYNISVKELKQLLSMLKGDKGKWPVHAVKLLGVLQSTTDRHGPDCFFSFPGVRDSAIHLPPLKTWPYANGFTFTTWFRMDPLNSLRVDMDKPYLYCFRNNKGLGYSGHFVGSCFIVTVLKTKGKGFQHCLKYDFKPRKWYMVTIVHIYNRWRSSEIRCYANGQIVSTSEMNWTVSTSDQYDKCFLGSAETGDDARVFCGQMAATYLFSESLNASQVYALFQLGPGYKNQFKFATESDHLLANHHRKVLYEDSTLSEGLVFAYNPKSTDGQLCLECSPSGNDGSSDKWFVHSHHALMLQDVKAVVTHSIHSALHSVGGAEVLFPLFAQLDNKQPDGSVDRSVCPTLLSFLLQLLQGSVKTQQQVLQGKGFLVIGTLLEKAHRDHINSDVLNTLISMSKFLDNLPTGLPLMRQFCDHILFNPALWIRTEPKVQLALYTYLATEFVSSPTIQTNLRRVSTVMLLVHALKHYYWVINPQPRSGVIPKGLDGPRPTKSEVLSLRAFILLFLKQLVTRSGNILEDELQSVLGYLLTIHEDENVLDVLQLMVRLMSEHGGSVAPVFDQKNGVAVVFKLLGSESELVRIHALKLLAYFLGKVSDKRKTELMDTQSLFMLIGERLVLYCDEMSVSTYNALYEVMIQNPSTQILKNSHPEPNSNTCIHNPAIMKVTANMLSQCSESNPSVMPIKLIFLSDMSRLFQINRDNRRILLQQSVWQDWMLSLGYFKPKSKDEMKCQELMFGLFKVLLYHAIKLEWGGWRVWVDTLAIVHSKVSHQAHNEYMEEMYKEYKSNGQNNQGTISTVSGLNKSEEPSTSAAVASTSNDSQIETEEETQDEDKHESETQDEDKHESETQDEDKHESETQVEDKHESETQVEDKHESEAEDVIQEEQKSQSGNEEDAEESEGPEKNESESPETKEDPPQESHEIVGSEEHQEELDEGGNEEREGGGEDKEELNAEGDATSKEDPASKQNVSEENEGETQDNKEQTEEDATEDLEQTPAADEESNEQQELEESQIKDQEEDVGEDKLPESEEAEKKVAEDGETTEEEVEDPQEVVEEQTLDQQEESKDEVSEKVEMEQVNEDSETPDEQTENKEEEEEEGSSKAEEQFDEIKLDEEKTSTIDTDKPASSKGSEMTCLDVSPLKQADEENAEENDTENVTTSPKQEFSPGPRTVVFRVPEFKWSDTHLRILDDLFTCLEGDIENWKKTNAALSEVVNSSDNLIFVHNTVHLVSQMIDNIILACGGILPILSSATSPNYELDLIESGQGMSMSSAWNILNRLANFMDVMAFASNISFSEIETEKTMVSGGVLRQCLRTACICAVRNCLETRYVHKTSSAPPPLPTSYNEVEVHSKVEDMVSASDAAHVLLSWMSNDATPIHDGNMLLQESDLGRLRSVIYRDADDSKQAEFLALAVVYFVSVLMVSKYRDILDPENNIRLKQATLAKKLTPKKRGSEAEMPTPAKLKDEETMVNGNSSPEHLGNLEDSGNGEAPTTNVQDILRNLTKTSNNDPNNLIERVTPNVFPTQAKNENSSYRSFDRSVVVKPKPEGGAEEPSSFSLPSTIPTEVGMKDGEENIVQDKFDHTDLPQVEVDTVNVMDNEVDVSSRLEKSMNQLAPLLRDIFLDFSGHLSKVLVGSHGQELLVEGLVCMKSYSSVVELVMLLCSQEWQNSIQKNAGLAFIELINEGRLLCHSMKDHVVRVANEADFIISKQRAEDVKRHAQFLSSSAIFLAQQRDEEKQCDSLISAAKHRDHVAAHVLKNRITNILTNKLGAWGSAFDSESREFWRLDPWEDDTRRRRRFVRNPYGSDHHEAALHTSKSLTTVPDAASNNIPRSPSNLSAQLDQSSSLEEDILNNQEELDQDELQGPVSFSSEAYLVCPGVYVNGTFSITPDEFFFEINELHETYSKIDPKTLIYAEGIHGKWLFQEVRAVFSRRYLLQNTALEIFLANRTCVMFNFPDAEIMKKVVSYLPRVGIGTGYGLTQARRISLASPRQLFKSSNMSERWQRREISNFEYIMFLNTISGRTFNDLNQYPVFPWIISNYEADEFDLSLPSNYRDLSKPIGALNPKRASYFQQRYENWEDANIPKFHYGTHYSNSAFTLGWMIRVEPFTTLFLNLQGGKFDHADRTFHSVLQSWKNCQRDSHDVKELIPEFFYLPEMFVNSSKYALGSNSENQKVDDVVLPKWAKSADDFVQKHRLALESEIVSCQLHQWIDLIFGFKQRGPEAVRATNVFYYLTYENSVNLDLIKDPIEKIGLREQVKNFGQTPSQLLLSPHSPRSSAMHLTPMMYKENELQDVVMVLKFQSNSPVVYVSANTHPSLTNPSVITCTKNLQFCVNKWNQAPDKSASSAPTNADADKTAPLPIEPDPLMNPSGTLGKRQIGDMIDQSIKVQTSCFAVTADNRFILSCGHWDRSFRVVSTETGKLHQVVFGHWDVVTCLSRSETYIGGDCYFVSGSRDATVMLWYWSGRRNLFVGDSINADVNPSARAVLTGHDTEVTCTAICAELGLIASGSLEGPILLHTITGDLLRSLEPTIDGTIKNPRPELIVFTSEGMILVSYNGGLLCNYTMNGRSISFKDIDDNIKAMLSSNNSHYLVTAGDKGVVKVWNTWDFKHLYTFPQCDAGIQAIALSHDQKTIITGMMSGSIVAFNINFNKWHYDYQNK